MKRTAKEIKLEATTQRMIPVIKNPNRPITESERRILSLLILYYMEYAVFYKFIHFASDA